MKLSFKTDNPLISSWVILAAAFIIEFVMFGIRYSYSVFFKSIVAEFDINRALTSAIFSCYLLLCGVFSVLGGWAMGKYGPKITGMVMGLFTIISLLLTSQATQTWQVFLTYSLLLAVGNGSTFTLVNAMICKWFTKKRGLALGIAGSGGGAGLLLIPVIAYLISRFDWRMTSIIVGSAGGLIIIIISALFLRNNQQDNSTQPNDKQLDNSGVEFDKKQTDIQTPGITIWEAFRTRSFWFLWFTRLLLSSCVYLVTTHIVPHATDIGISTINAAFIISIIGCTSIAGKLFGGGSSDIISKRAIFVFLALLGFAAMVLLLFIKDLWMFYLFAGLFGLCWGGIIVTITVTIAEVFGNRDISLIIGWTTTAWFLGAAVGPFIGGLIFDHTGSYLFAFIIGAICFLLIAIFTAIITRQQKAEV